MQRKQERRKLEVDHDHLGVSVNRAPDPAADAAEDLSERPSVRVLVESNGSCPFDRFINDVRDDAAKARILLRLLRIEQTGNIGDHRDRIAGAISELRIDYGPGYRLYYVMVGTTIIVLLCGGTKGSQQKDIAAAVALWERNHNDAERFSREFRG